MPRDASPLRELTVPTLERHPPSRFPRPKLPVEPEPAQELLKQPVRDTCRRAALGGIERQGSRTRRSCAPCRSRLCRSERSDVEADRDRMQRSRRAEERVHCT